MNAVATADAVSLEGVMPGHAQADMVGEITRLLEPFRKSGGPITAETDIARDLELDSLAVMDLMMQLEERFDISIPLNLVPEIQKVADLAAAIARIKREG